MCSSDLNARLSATTAAMAIHSGCVQRGLRAQSSVAAKAAALACPLGKLDVDGVRQDGTTEPLMRAGNWAVPVGT